MEEEEERVAEAAGTAGRHEGGGLVLVQHLGVREGGRRYLPGAGEGIESPDVVKPLFVQTLSGE